MTETLIWLVVGFLILSVHSWFIMHNRGEIIRLERGVEILNIFTKLVEINEEKKVSELEQKLSKDKANLDGLGGVHDES